MRNGYTEEEAKYGADNCGSDWNSEALATAKEGLLLRSYRTITPKVLYELFFQNNEIRKSAIKMLSSLPATSARASAYAALRAPVNYSYSIAGCLFLIHFDRIVH